jgi:Polyketide cyclase / dehydrase and lipid transport
VLPRIDEHWIDIAASPAHVWAALEAVVIGALGEGPWRRLYATLVGARDTEQSGHGLTVGATLVGFRVAEADPPRDLLFDGVHRFARYALRFRVTPTDSGARVGAITDAEFPGLFGRGYRMLVIGTGGHALVVHALLRGIKERAERAG